MPENTPSMERTEEKKKTVNSQHEAGKEGDRQALKSRNINRAEPKFSKFVWLSSSRPSSPSDTCRVDFRSSKFKENANLNTFFHMTLLAQPE